MNLSISWIGFAMWKYEKNMITARKNKVSTDAIVIMVRIVLLPDVLPETETATAILIPFCQLPSRYI